MANVVKWDTEELENTYIKLGQEKEKLEAEYLKLRIQSERVDAHWQSPAGRDYQARLVRDIETVKHIIEQLDERIASLTRVRGIYEEYEQSLDTAMSRLP